MFRFTLLALIGVSCVHATSIVVKFGEQRIVIVADTLGVDAAGGVHEDQCKIVRVGSAAFAATGISSFTPSLTPNVSGVADWDAKSEAKDAHAAHKNDVDAAANEWLARAERYFRGLPLVDRMRARSLTDGDPDHVLVGGVFVGWTPSGNAKLIMEYVRFEEPDLTQVQHLIQIPPVRDLPYTTNAATQKLFEGDSTLTKLIGAKWEIRAKSFPKSERNWRWLEFLVQQTSEYAKVGTRVDVLELRRNGPPEWLQNLTCR